MELENLIDSLTCKYDLDVKNIITYNDLIALENSKNGLFVFFDYNGNLICGANKPENISYSDFVTYIEREYSGKNLTSGFSFPFNIFSIKDFVDISSKNEMLNKENNVITPYALLLGDVVKNTLIENYHLVQNGNDIFDVYMKINGVIKDFDRCTSTSILFGDRLWPVELLDKAALDKEKYDMNNLYDVCNFLLLSKGYKITGFDTMEECDSLSKEEIFDMALKLKNNVKKIKLKLK